MAFTLHGHRSASLAWTWSSFRTKQYKNTSKHGIKDFNALTAGSGLPNWPEHTKRAIHDLKRPKAGRDNGVGSKLLDLNVQSKLVENISIYLFMSASWIVHLRGSRSCESFTPGGNGYQLDRALTPPQRIQRTLQKRKSANLQICKRFNEEISLGIDRQIFNEDLLSMA